MRTVIKILVLFALLSIASSISIKYFNVQFGDIDFWEVHGFWFLIFIALFPRLTLLFSSVAFGGIFWWLGFIFAPRLLVAMLATFAYWNTNKILVVFAWLAAVGGESSEKYYIHRHTFRTNRHKINKYKDVVEAEFHEVKE